MKDMITNTRLIITQKRSTTITTKRAKRLMLEKWTSATRWLKR
jgi:hypothetical protein